MITFQTIDYRNTNEVGVCWSGNKSGLKDDITEHSGSDELWNRVPFCIGSVHSGLNKSEHVPDPQSSSCGPV